MLGESKTVELTKMNEIMNTLDANRFLRAPLRRTIALSGRLGTAVSTNEPLKMLLMWGANGEKESADDADHRAVAFLDAYRARIRKSWQPGVKLTVLFTDTHVMLNGRNPAAAERYFASVKTAFDGIAPEFMMLSKLWDEAGLTLRRVAADADYLADEWTEFAEKTGLVRAAGRHSLRRPPEPAARLYIASRLVENPLIEHRFRNHILITSDPPELSRLLPYLPIIHMYSYGRGRCAKPWHVHRPQKES